MFNLRRIIIVAVSFLVVVVFYFAATNMTDTTESVRISGSGESIGDSNLAFDGETFGSIGDVDLGQMEQACYTARDEHTKKLKRIFGFSKLLRQVGENWDLEKPYMKMFESSFNCDVRSDTGSVQVEMIGNQPTPKDAQLKGNVVIHIMPSGQSKMQESYIYMDDVVFNSDNSQFSTDGPVRFVSKDAEMVGVGMQMIYNSVLERLELLRIIDVEFVHIKSYKSSSFVAGKAEDENTSAVSNAESAKPIKIVADNTNKQPDGVVVDDTRPKYRCLFSDNVVIKYDNQYIYANQVSLSNIIFGGGNDKSPLEQVSAGDTATASVQPDTADSQPVVQDEPTEIFITCNGGITVRPMEYFKQTTDARIVEFTGRPVEIKRPTVAGDDDILETVAKCGFLKYDIDEELISLSAYMLEKYVSIYLDDAGAFLETIGSVEWKLHSDNATVNGPGKICIPNQNNTAENTNDASDAGMSFDGIMKLYFAEAGSGGLLNNTPIISRIDFLDGDVNVKSDSANLNAPAANIYFAQNNGQPESRLIDYIDFNEGFNGRMGTGSQSDVKADIARLHFNQREELVQADLKGSVMFNSAKGQVLAENVKVIFDKDSDGKTYAKSVEAADNAVVKPKSDRNTDSSFWADTIDYDLTTGNAFAKGPVKFMFYTNDSNDDSGQAKSPIPVVVTADEARFHSSKNQVVLKGNVVSEMTDRKQQFEEINKSYSEKMIIDLASSEGAADTADILNDTGITHLSMTGRKVRLTSEKTSGGKRLSATELVCRQMDYDAVNRIITAIGGADAAEIQIDNSNATQTDGSSNKVTMKTPCYALIKHFETLKWYLDRNRVEADGDSRRLYAAYLPINPDGTQAEPTKVNCGHIEANFIETSPGKNEISTVVATRGISYEDEKYQFEGGNLFYETGSSFVRITGSSGMNCLFNGAIVDSIEYNLETGKASAQAGHSPGVLPIR